MTSAHELSVSAVMFDMDGTLVNSIAVAEAMWSRLADEAALPAVEVIRYSHGRQIVDSVARFLPNHSPEEQDRITRRLMQQEIDHAHIVTEIAGAGALMAALIEADVPVALVTSAARNLALLRMRYARVPIPSVVVAAEDVTHGKPAPDAYLLAAHLLKVPASQCAVFEDAEAGLRSALAAGTRVVVVGDHRSPTTTGLTRISSFAETDVAVQNGAVQLTIAPRAQFNIDHHP